MSPGYTGYIISSIIEGIPGGGPWQYAAFRKYSERKRLHEIRSYYLRNGTVERFSVFRLDSLQRLTHIQWEDIYNSTVPDQWKFLIFHYTEDPATGRVSNIYKVRVRGDTTDTLTTASCTYHSSGLLVSMHIIRYPYRVTDPVERQKETKHEIVSFEYDADNYLTRYYVYTEKSTDYHNSNGPHRPILYTYELNRSHQIQKISRAWLWVGGLFEGRHSTSYYAGFDEHGRMAGYCSLSDILPSCETYFYSNDTVRVVRECCYPDIKEVPVDPTIIEERLVLTPEGLPYLELVGDMIVWRSEYTYW